MNEDQHQNVGKQVFPLGKSTPDHRTPKSFFESWGTFDLDAAASKENALCERFYDEEKDGLNQPWDAHRVWVNPPYSQCGLWIEKAIYEAQVLKNCEEVVILVPARTCTKWFRNAFEHAASIVFVHGRLNFTGPHMNKQSKANAPFPSILISIHQWVQPERPSIYMCDREGTPLE